MESTPTDYDQVIYPSYPHPESHPDRLRILAELLGLPAPPREGARILELGCAAGGNLIPLAYTLPASTLVGVDLSEVQIGIGQRAIEALGLGDRVRLISGDLGDLDVPPGSFDVILAHGLLSWVDAPTRARVFAQIYRLLKEGGLAYVCYSTYPGFHLRAMARDATLFHTRSESDPTARGEEGHRMLHFLAESVPEGDPAREVYRGERETVEAVGGSWYLLHDLMEADHNALYLKDFVREAAEAGLGYVADVHLDLSLPELFPPAVAEAVQHLARDRVEAEQYLDFVQSQAMRRSVLIKGPAPVTLKAAPQPLLQMSLASSLKAMPPKGGDTEVVFVNRWGKNVALAHPLAIAALEVLEARWPQSLPFGALLGHAYRRMDLPAPKGEALRRACGTLATFLLRCHMQRLVEVQSAPLPFTLTPGERPLAHPLARLWCADDEVVPSFRHEPVRLTPEARALLPLLDGTRDRPALAQALGVDFAEIDARLAWIALRALIQEG